MERSRKVVALDVTAPEEMRPRVGIWIRVSTEDQA